MFEIKLKDKYYMINDVRSIIYIDISYNSIFKKYCLNIYFYESHSINLIFDNKDDCVKYAEKLLATLKRSDE